MHQPFTPLARTTHRLRGALAAAALLLPGAYQAQAQTQTGSVGIGTTSPAPSAALEVRSTSQGLLLPRLTLAQRNALTASTTAPPVPGLLIYLTDSTPGLYAYDGTAWVRLGADNLGNHTATQTLDLNAQRLLGSLNNSLGDSTAQVELTASVGTQSSALMTRSNFGARYSRTILSGYGKLPEGTTTANDFGIWSTAYRGGGWAGFFSAGGSAPGKEPLRFVGICQHPGYNNTGSAIRIVDGTQGAGRVLTSDARGYGTWQPVPAPTAAGGNFDLGTYQLVGNGGSQGLSITNVGNVGIGTTPVTGARLQVSGTALVGGGAVPNTTNATGIGWNAVTVGGGETELYNYRGSGSGGFRFFSVSGTGAPTTSNDIAFINNTGVYSTLSDRRVKTNITALGQGLRQVMALRPVSYDFHTSRRLQDGVVTFLPDDQLVRALGFVAQDLLQVVPEAVEKPADDKQAFYTVSYTTLVPVLTQAIQEQQAQIETLQKQNAALQARAATAEAAATQATSAAGAAQAQAAHATATLETFETRLRRLEATSAQAQR